MVAVAVCGYCRIHSDMSSDLLMLLNRVAGAMESVVPGLSLRAVIGGLVRLEDDVTDNITDSRQPDQAGERVGTLGFEMTYRDESHGAFWHASSGSEREQVQSVALELMSNVLDVVAEVTTEPWPLVILNNRKDMALADAAIDGDELYMWYGERGAPALRLPPVHLV